MFSFSFFSAFEADVSPITHVAQVEVLTRRNQDLLVALDMKERELAHITALFETNGDALSAGVRQSKIIEVVKKNRQLTLSVEREKAEKERLMTELKMTRISSQNGRHDMLRSEAQVEAACREVVAEASESAKLARKELAVWKEKARQVAAWAERSSGRFTTVKAENERLRKIIKQEVGAAPDGLNRLEEAFSEQKPGGWRGRAQQIQKLRLENTSLKQKLERANQLPSTTGAEELLVHDVVSIHSKSQDGIQVERADVAKLELKLKQAGLRKCLVEKELRDVRERLQALTDKCANDDQLISALQRELHRKSEVTLLKWSETGLPGQASSQGSSSKNMVPAVVHNVVEHRAKAQEQQLHMQSRVINEIRQQNLQLRAKVATLEYEISANSQGNVDVSSTRNSDAAVGLEDGSLAVVLTDQNAEDVEALIIHTEGLESLVEILKGKLYEKETQVDQLRTYASETRVCSICQGSTERVQ